MCNMEMIWTERPAVKEQSHHSEGSCIVSFYRLLKKKRQVVYLELAGKPGLVEGFREGALMNFKGSIWWR